MMISCDKVRLAMAEYAAGDLPPALADLMAAHLSGCEECRLEMEMEKLLQRDLAAMPLVACPRDVSEIILAAVEDESRPEDRRRAPVWAWPALTAMAAVLALALLMPPSEAPVRQTAHHPYTETEIRAASGQARLVLARVARTLNSNEQTTMERVFGEEISPALGASLLNLTRNLKGES